MLWAISVLQSDFVTISKARLYNMEGGIVLWWCSGTENVTFLSVHCSLSCYLLLFSRTSWKFV